MTPPQPRTAHRLRRPDATPPPVVVAAAFLVAVEGLSGVFLSVVALGGAGGGWSLPRLDELAFGAGEGVAVILFLLAVGLLLAAGFLLTRSRIAQVYALALQAMLMLGVAAGVTRGLAAGVALAVLTGAALAGTLLLSTPLRRWCDVPIR